LCPRINLLFFNGNIVVATTTPHHLTPPFPSSLAGHTQTTSRLRMANTKGSSAGAGHSDLDRAILHEQHQAFMASVLRTGLHKCAPPATLPPIPLPPPPRPPPLERLLPSTTNTTAHEARMRESWERNCGRARWGDWGKSRDTQICATKASGCGTQSCRGGEGGTVERATMSFFTYKRYWGYFTLC
jgi:hypothetical protein